MNYSVFLCLIAGFATALFWKRRQLACRSDTALSAGPWFLREATWISAPAIVAMTFAGLSDIDIAPPGWIKKPNPSQVATHHASRAVPQGSDLTLTNANLPAERTDGLSQRPAWVDLPRTTDGLSDLVVLSSQQFSTREEAEQALSAEALELVSRDLQQLYPGKPRSSWQPTGEQIQKVAVKQKYVEVADRDFGKFSHPMYRVWWQVELSPEVRTEFLPAWRQSLTTLRIRQIGVVVSTLVLITSLIAICCRLDVLTRGTRRGQLGALTGGTALVWLAAVLFVAERWL